MKLGVFIAGRLKSERLPDKLILPLNGSCLWEMACKKLNDIDPTYQKYALCYEDELIEIASKYSNIKIIVRDKNTSIVDEPLEYIFKDLKEVDSTHLMFLNPCLSFLTKETIEISLDTFRQEFIQRGVEYATSAKEYKNWVFDEHFKSVTPIDYKCLSTKTIPIHYETAHCFHIFNKDNFFTDGQMLKVGHSLIQVPSKEVIDIDNQEDYEFAQWKWYKTNKKNVNDTIKKTYVIDIDGTICNTKTLDYAKSTPIQNRINYFNNLYAEGNFIIYQTARGYVSKIDWKEETEKQLTSWGVKYDELKFNKPNADIYIDDKALNINDIEF